MRRTRLFLNNRSQSVRLPKEAAFPPGVQEVAIRCEGAFRIIGPTDRSWDDFFDEPGLDLSPRDQPPPQAREAF